jgi:hypothetical protein
MHRLIVRQVKGAERFVVSHADGRSADSEATVASPVGWAVVRAGSEGKLSGELRWYLESFLDYPFPPQTTRAEGVEASLEAWGAQAFTALFGAGTGRDFYSDAARSGLEQLHLQIISNDASVLAWPWEALRDPQGDRWRPPVTLNDGSMASVRRNCPPSCRRTISTFCWSRLGLIKGTWDTARCPGRWWI